MNQLLTKGIILARTEYGEAARIITLLTPDHGKLRLLAKGVRRVKSKLAGGIELFSISHITYIRGRGEIGTLISSRLETHYGHIAQDITRTMLGYELIKQLNRATEDQPEPEYFHLLQQAFEALDDAGVDVELIRFWFAAQIIKLAGHRPNLQTDTAGEKLDVTADYEFDIDTMAFRVHPGGAFGADHIKFLRLLFSDNTPKVLTKIKDAPELVASVSRLVIQMQQQYIR